MPDIRKNTLTTAVIGMNQDQDPQVLKEGGYISAINSRLHTHKGSIPFVSNEPSNFSCLNLPFTMIGSVKMADGRFAIFSTNDTQSEIGLFDERTCAYERKVRSTCLGFNRKNLIRGVGNKDVVYWTDGLNPRRYLDFTNIPYTYIILDDDCGTKEFTTNLNCDELLIDKKISYPKIEVSFGTDGRLGNGSYQVALAYTISGQVATDWLGVTFPIKSFDHAPRGRSLEIKLSNLDQDFDGYALAVIYTVNGVTAVDRVGLYEANENNIVVTNVGPTAINNILMTLDEIVNKRPVYGTAKDVVATSRNLIWSSPSIKPEMNYQPDAMNIRATWVAYKIPKDFYRKGGNLVGYMRDEVYTFAIQWLYATGDWSVAYHIPGRRSTGREIKPIAGHDVYEKTGGVCDTEELPKYFEVYNTAKLLRRYPEPATNFCNPSIIAEGEMAYWESTENYRDSDIFPDDRCTPIRHHKFPDCHIIHHHEDETPIILGVKFDNIKKPDGVVGYRIVRGDRQGNRSVIAKGLLFNTGSYEDNGDQWMYPNYPYNDLRPDPFLSSTQTKFSGRETDYNALGTFSNTKFTFHSPSTTFNKPILGTELKIESEEIATVKGRFQEVYRHPKYKLITNFTYGMAAIIGAASAVLAINGRKCVTAGTMPVAAGAFEFGTGSVTGTPSTFSYSTECNTELTGKVGFPGGIASIRNAPGIAVAFGYYFATGLQTVINLVKVLSSWEQLAYQYNSHGFYNDHTHATTGSRRRRINYAQYLIPGNQDINNVKMNNFNRESSVYLELNKAIARPRTHDNSRNTVSGFGLCDDVNRPVISTASSFYGSIKRKIPNQYGQLNAIRYLDTGTNFDATFATPDDEFLASGDIFGGDTYVSRFTEKRKLTYFLLWPFDVPDGWEWDYRRYANIRYPRFWLDGSDFDYGDMARLRLPSSKHNLDCYRRGDGIFTVKDRYMYLSNNGVIDYYAESEYCPDYRDWDDTIEGRHYDWHSYTNLQEMFRSDKIQFDNRFLFDKVYLKQLNENFIRKQDITFDPADPVEDFPNRIIYSLAAGAEQVRDNWLIYPGLNYHEFGEEDGNITAIRAYDRDRLIFLFDRSGPKTTLGVDTLQTDGGTKVLIGDGGLFANIPGDLITTDYAYGSCENNTYCSTHLGGIYPSQEQGRIFKFTGSTIQDITRNGMYWWFREHLPSKLLTDYPDFIHRDNPLVGVGVTSVFDNTDEIYYLSKKDYRVKDQWKSVTTYDKDLDQWRVRGIKVDFKDPLIFEEASFTVSYDCKSEVWISFHDWIPELSIQTEKHFITSKELGLWKHNDRVDSYCNFYGQVYPWEVELSYSNGQGTSTLSSLEYILECFQFANRVDKYHVKDFNFNELTVFNSEQTSGLIKLEKRPKLMISPFPLFSSNHIKCEYEKVEQKYRINQFWDITKDRNKNVPLMITQPNGYRKVVNKVAVNYGKESLKKFRHNYGNLILRRTDCEDKWMTLKFVNEKQVLSPR